MADEEVERWCRRHNESQCKNCICYSLVDVSAAQKMAEAKVEGAVFTVLADEFVRGRVRSWVQMTRLEPPNRSSVEESSCLGFLTQESSARTEQRASRRGCTGWKSKEGVPGRPKRSGEWGPWSNKPEVTHYSVRSLSIQLPRPTTKCHSVRPRLTSSHHLSTGV